MSSVSEETFQRIFLAQVRTFYPDIVISVSLSGIDLSGLNPMVKAKLVSNLKLNHWEKGIPDVTLYLPDAVTLNLEFKRLDGKGVQSKTQKEMEQNLKNLGHTYYIIDSYEQGWDCIKENTTVDYRREWMNKLVKGLSKPSITEPFLMFPVGTSTDGIVEVLEEKYQLKA